MSCNATIELDVAKARWEGFAEGSRDFGGGGGGGGNWVDGFGFTTQLCHEILRISEGPEN